jgi:hypothetical protein
MITRKRSVFFATIILSLSVEALPQASDHRLEVGMQYTSMQVSVLDSTESGIGGRFGVKVNRYLTAEGEFNFCPESRLGNSGFEQKGQGLIGVKSGYSNRRIGLFGKFRPGFVQFPMLKLPAGLCRVAGDTVVCSRTGRTGHRLAFDLGGVAEFYPAPNYVIRVDVGDTMVRFKDDTFFTFPNPTRVKDGFSHNLQVSAGFSFRF